MATSRRIHYVGRRVFGAIKRPIFDATQALSGHRLQATTEYLDFGMYGGTFEAPAQAVQSRLPPGFAVYERRPGVTELEIWAADYRQMDILQPYRELAVLAPVQLSRPEQLPVEGTFVLQMVVTSEEARWAGVDIFGFPKFVADIDVRYRDGLVTCTCHHRGVHVLSLRVDARATQQLEDRSVFLNVRRDGRIIEANFDRSGQLGQGDEPGGVGIELGDDAIADQLRAIGVRLNTGRAIYLPHCHGVLHKAVDLGPLAAPPEALRYTAAAGTTTAITEEVRAD